MKQLVETSHDVFPHPLWLLDPSYSHHISEPLLYGLFDFLIACLRVAEDSSVCNCRFQKLIAGVPDCFAGLLLGYSGCKLPDCFVGALGGGGTGWRKRGKVQGS